MWGRYETLLRIAQRRGWSLHCGESQAVQGKCLTGPSPEHNLTHLLCPLQTCEPVRKLPTCRYFRDITWTLTTMTAKSEHSLNSLLAGSAPLPGNHHESENVTRQEMKCICPHNSVAYVFKHHYFTSPDGNMGYRYHFACSPETVRIAANPYLHPTTTAEHSSRESPFLSVGANCPRPFANTPAVAWWQGRGRALLGNSNWPSC